MFRAVQKLGQINKSQVFNCWRSSLSSNYQVSKTQLFKPSTSLMTTQKMVSSSTINHERVEKEEGNCQDSNSFKFFSFDVTDQVFFKSKHSFAIVNLKPISPGHVLVIPRRTEVLRLKDLRDDELSDFFKVVQEVGSVLEKIYDSKSLNVAIQDGPFAGQSVPHLHAHIIPRCPKDFVPNDKVYDFIEQFNFSRDHYLQNLNEDSLKVDNNERLPRSKEEMNLEASMLAKHFL